MMQVYRSGLKILTWYVNGAIPIAVLHVALMQPTSIGSDPV